MESKWRKAKVALGLNLCVYVPRTSDDSPPSLEAAGRFSDVSSTSSVTGNPDSRPAMPTTPIPSSSGLRLPKNGSGSLKRTCAICLATMTPGDGLAIFTAECSHAFHFQCIASNVKHGSQTCPVCRVKWREVPFQGPSSDLIHGKARINPVDWPQDDAWMTVLRRLPPSRPDSLRPIASPFQAPEPSLFNDDDPLEIQPLSAERISSSNDDLDKNPNRTMDLKTYPEVSAVSRLTSLDSFNVLIHLKAPVASSGQNMAIGEADMPATSQTSRAPVDLVTVLDVSGSMAGTKLALLKRAMGFVIQNLGPSDRLSVIAFSSTARRLFPLRRMTDAGRQHALLAVNSLISNGGTNIAEGLRKAAKVMEDRREKSPVGSIILLSDGQDTYTVSGPVGSQPRPNYQSLLPSSVRGASNTGHQIPVHAFGFGADHDAASMHSIAEASGGTFSFIEAEGVIQDAFAQCIGGLLSVVVQESLVEIECVHPALRLCSVKAGSYSSHVMDDARTGYIDVGDLYADEERDFLLSVNVPAVQESTDMTSLVKVRCVYKDPVTKERLTLEGDEVRIERPQIAGQSVVSIDVDRQKNRLQAADAMAGARAAAEHGDFTGAVSILEGCRRALAETASARAGDRLCVALDAELKEMQERMASRKMYETSGRAYVLSGLSSHSWQRATTRGDSTESTSLVQAYQTPTMVDMVTRSHSMLLGRPTAEPLIRRARSIQVRTQPR
ncbi:E3 ubiquitin-protein ligase WAV3-like [Macadamia integrifolia]|uniref:E3 ubiquitin-protein ligase WAV3-like n=1 Tax=Macadamia integrifolia TaxID=60698 RepID=UPI001C533B2B|nr:E3 ubiquitin-protein ligase WAV3-like [Macadamia integrifolia]XP_042476086.1 E3 ubiquitin-protein ligase WAV3-like [Macadamia integrifolia]XP_042476087.1 E3 ubiquitin-protein ligase WAV3-like [Macadamia integrifolia]XP_042476088.1 E3 ubiquitin-protein ligase WAV3-like [Macadamia integrifolia]